jgi:hypothetical protein
MISNPVDSTTCEDRNETFLNHPYFPLGKSEDKLDQHLRAFFIRCAPLKKEISLESAFQRSKVFEKGGPYTDLWLTAKASTENSGMSV